MRNPQIGEDLLNALQLENSLNDINKGQDLAISLNPEVRMPETFEGTMGYVMRNLLFGEPLPTSKIDPVGLNPSSFASVFG